MNEDFSPFRQEMGLKNKREAEHHLKPKNCEVPDEDQDKFHQSEEVTASLADYEELLHLYSPVDPVEFSAAFVGVTAEGWNAMVPVFKDTLTLHPGSTANSKTSILGEKKGKILNSCWSASGMQERLLGTNHCHCTL